MNILVIDDDRVILLSLSKVLNNKGHNVVTANNAYEALSYLQYNDVHLVISDIMMPGLSGIEFMNILKQFYYNKVPLIFISSISKQSIVKLFGNVYGRHYIQKPINFIKLNCKINSLMPKREYRMTFR